MVRDHHATRPRSGASRPSAPIARVARVAHVARVVLAVAVVLGGLTLVSAPSQALTATRAYGSQPADDILAVAASFVASQPAGCGLTQQRLAAMMMVPTFSETGATASTAPGPMTMSRWDTSTSLWAFGNKSTPYQGAFWSPGVGMWQFDSAGGWNLTAATAINTQTSAAVAGQVMGSRFCASTKTDQTEKMRYAWGPWSECSSGSLCPDLYNAIFDGTNLLVNRLTNVSRLGGMIQRSCNVEGIGAVACGWVNPALAEGDRGWTATNPVIPTPLTKPFYVFQANNREYRYWLAQDTGYGVTVIAWKPITSNTRTSLTWSIAAAGSQLCDVTIGVGVSADTGTGWSSWQALAPAGGDLGDPSLTANSDGRLEAVFVGAGGQVVHSWQSVPNGGWSGPVPLDTSGAMTTAFTATDAKGFVQAFALDANGSVWVDRQTTGAWTGWTKLGAGLSKLFGVTANTDGRLELFGLDGAGTFVHQWQSGATWSAWTPLGGSPVFTAAMARNADGHMEAFAVTNANVLVHRWQVPGSNTGWSDWATLPGGYIGKPSVSTNLDGRLEIHIRGFGSGMWDLAQAPGSATGWAGPTRLGSVVLASDPVTARNRDGRLETFAPLTTGVLGHLWQNSAGGTWSGWATLPGITPGSMGATKQADGRMMLIARQTDNSAWYMVQAH